ncbi:MAG: sulfotransferase [Planctomyces sp.]
MQRPVSAPQSISRCRPTFQFPKTILHPFLRPIIRLMDAGWLPAVRHEHHVVICGFPRSGTTLFQLMVEASCPEIQAYGKERRALEIARFGRRSRSRVVTKRPRDLFLIDSIRDFCQHSHRKIHFVLFHRDPRAVLTSRHFRKPDEYYVSVEEWRHLYAHWKWHRTREDVLSVSYEQLVSDSESVQRQFQELTGWTDVRSFQNFDQAIPRHFDGRALNGIRKVDPSNCDRWKADTHRERIRQLLDQMPELPQVLIEMGYESDCSWTADFEMDHPSDGSDQTDRRITEKISA